MFAEFLVAALAAGFLLSFDVQAFCGLDSSTWLARPPARSRQARGDPLVMHARPKHSFPMTVMKPKYVVLKRKKAEGFTVIRKNFDSFEAVKYDIISQRKRYLMQLGKGANASEVFVRFPGLLPWKRLGDITHKRGDFREAVRTQWPLLCDHTYYLYKRCRKYLVSEVPIEFGYANEEAEIVHVHEGCLPEAFPRGQVKAMLADCGFQPEEKDFMWRDETYRTLSNIKSKKDHLIYKPRIVYRSFLRKPVNADLTYNVNVNKRLIERRREGKKKKGLLQRHGKLQWQRAWKR